MRYEFIESHSDEFPITLMCDVLSVSTSGYYDWRGREPSQRQQENQQLLEEIEQIHAASRGTYGSPRVHRELQAVGWTVGRNRVARIMRENGIRAVQKRSRRRTTNSNHDFPVAPNLIDRQFDVDGPNEVWLADITYVPTREGWLYLAAVLDLYSRKIVGWAMSDSMSRQLCIDALTMAALRRKPPEGLIHHSDRGSQYASYDYQKLLATLGMTCSMSRKGDCLDNAPMESFFGTLKQESLHRMDFTNRDEARREIFSYIEGFYNRQRRHSALGYQTPTEYEDTGAAHVA